jgi:hypothetical protein
MYACEVDGDFVTFKSGNIGVVRPLGDEGPFETLCGEFSFKRHKNSQEVDAKRIVDGFIDSIRDIVSETYQVQIQQDSVNN